jgi:hypothetical protein
MVMTKKNIRKDIKEITKISRNIPSLMETIHFSPEREREMYEAEDELEAEPEMGMEAPHEEIPASEPEMGASAEPEVGIDAPMEGKEIVDKIRKMALRAMADLADNTEDSYYSVLKKIWQMADKNPEEEKNKAKGE